MSDLHITYAEMSDSASRMRNNKDHIDAMLGECQSIVGNLVASGFKTREASGKFELTHEEFVSSATTVNETLGQLSKWLDMAAEALRNMDTELTTSLNR